MSRSPELEPQSPPPAARERTDGAPQPGSSDSQSASVTGAGTASVERSASFDRPAHAERSERPERSDRPDRTDRPDRPDRQGGAARGGRAHGLPTGVQPAKVFIEGRYRKLSRDLPQTVFFCPQCKGHPRRRRGCVRCEGFGKLTRDSVQELIGWVVGAAFKTRKNKFHGAGREDVNVRMLGAGRPFVMELVGPKNHAVDLAAVEAEINRRNAGRLEVEGLHWTEKARVRAIKENKHAKEYRALIQLGGEIDPTRVAALVGKRIQVFQNTPERVAHRRAQLERERWIELLALEPAEDSRWSVTLRTQHGTYVKEAISGEAGHTQPSLAELVGVSCECLELDVVAILDEEGKAALGVGG